MRRRAFEAVRGGRRLFLYTGCILGLAVLAAGCTKHLSSVDYVDVSGKVLYKGKPLPGGRITFVTTKGGFATSGNIDPNGNYKVKAPVGEVRIAVDNEMLKFAHKNPTDTAMMQHGGGGEVDPLKGTYVSLPYKYSNPATSGLTYTVQPGNTNHDITLE